MRKSKAMARNSLLMLGCVVVFLVGAVILAFGYPLTRARHREILAELDARRSNPLPDSPTPSGTH